MDIFENEEELYHHGIKGQRWGIRRYQNKDGSLTPAGKKRYMNDARWRAKYEAQKQREYKKEESTAERRKRLRSSTDANELYKHRSELTNDEIRDRITRIKLEQELSTYVKREPTRMEKAQKKIDAVMKSANKIAEFAESKAGKMIAKELKKQLGIEDAPSITDYKKFMSNMSGKTDKQIKDMLDRYKNERELRRLYNQDNPQPEQTQTQNTSHARRRNPFSRNNFRRGSSTNPVNPVNTDDRLLNTHERRDVTDDWLNSNQNRNQDIPRVDAETVSQAEYDRIRNRNNNSNNSNSGNSSPWTRVDNPQSNTSDAWMTEEERRRRRARMLN